MAQITNITHDAKSDTAAVSGDRKGARQVLTVLTTIGLMSGPSLDGVHAAILHTDGEDHIEHGETLFVPYGRELKVWVRRAIKAASEGRDGAADIGKADGELTLAHVEAVEELLDQSGIKRAHVDVIGFHGHTILHRPARSAETVGRSWSIGDGRVLADETRIDVVNDFRKADIAAGGEGAPLSPIYVSALARQSHRAAGSPEDITSAGVINFGKAANVTYVPMDARGIDLVSFDCGPGVGLADEWMELKAGLTMDEGGKAALAGKVHTDILRMMLLNPYMRRKPPKFVDHPDFRMDPVLGLSLNDGAATLTAFSAACVRASQKLLPGEPDGWIVVGGGRKNPALMQALGKALDAPVETGEQMGWRADMLDAECMAYLAVRSLRKLPLTYPMTTRVPRPILGGTYYRASI